MAALTDFDSLPIFDPFLYEKEALKLKEGQSEDDVDDALRNAAVAAGIGPNDLQLPPQPDAASAAASPQRRSSVSGNTQASCSTDVTTPESPASTDDQDRPAASSPPARRSASAAPPPMQYSRHSTSSLTSMRSPKPKFIRRMSALGKKYFSHDEDRSRSPSKHTSVHRFGDVKGRITYKYPRVKEGSVGSLTDLETRSATVPEPSRSSSPDSVISHHQRTSNCFMNESQRAALKLVMDNAAFREMWCEYSKRWERIVVFEVKQKRLLQFYERFSRKSLNSQWDSIKDQIAAKHSQEVERLEDRQVKADLTLLESQNEERLHSAAALKHMKAYCNGSSVPGSQKKRVVTEEDKRRLREQEKFHEELDKKHESARSMARARQEKELKDLKHDHEQEWKELETRHKEARAELSRLSQELSRHLDDVIRTRRLRATTRWYISLKLWDKSTGEHDDIPPLDDIPNVPWPDKATAETLATRTSSILDTYVAFNNLPPAVSLSLPVAVSKTEYSA